MGGRAQSRGPLSVEDTENGGGRPSSIVLTVRVVPGASRSEIVGVEGDALKVRVASPPVRGKANKELCKMLARALGVASQDVEMVAGHTTRRKKVRVYGARPDAVSNLFARPGDSTG